MNLPALFCSAFSCLCNRRSFLRRAGNGFGMLALAGLLENEGLLAAADAYRNPMAPRASHFPTKAKSAIWLCPCWAI